MYKLRQVRKARGWSLTDVTVKTGIPESSLSALERGLLPAHPGWQRRISKAFRLPREELFSEAERDRG